jgi:hypothetical protein
MIDPTGIISNAATLGANIAVPDPLPWLGAAVISSVLDNTVIISLLV